LTEKYHSDCHRKQYAHENKEEQEWNLVEHTQGHEIINEEPENRKTETQHRLDRGNTQVF